MVSFSRKKILKFSFLGFSCKSSADTTAIPPPFKHHSSRLPSSFTRDPLLSRSFRVSFRGRALVPSTLPSPPGTPPPKPSTNPVLISLLESEICAKSEAIFKLTERIKLLESQNDSLNGDVEKLKEDVGKRKPEDSSVVKSCSKKRSREASSISKEEFNNKRHSQSLQNNLSKSASDLIQSSSVVSRSVSLPLLNGPRLPRIPNPPPKPAGILTPAPPKPPLLLPPPPPPHLPLSAPPKPPVPPPPPPPRPLSVSKTPGPPPPPPPPLPLSAPPKLPGPPPPPPRPLSASKTPGTPPPPPPPLPFSASSKPPGPPPPPPPSLKGSIAGGSKLKRMPEVVELYNSLVRKNSQRDGCKGDMELAASRRRDMIGEIENRSAHLLAIKADVDIQADFIKYLIKEVGNAAFKAIEDVVPFVRWLDDELSYLVDERAVLKNFDWPEQKADALREAAFAYSDVRKLVSEASSFRDDGLQPFSTALKNMQALLEKLEQGTYSLSRLRESVSNKYKVHHIPTEWLLEAGCISQIKLASVKLVTNFINRIFAEIENLDDCDYGEGEVLLVQGVKFAFRVHQFAGGFDAETMKKVQELSDKVKVCHNQQLGAI